MLTKQKQLWRWSSQIAPQHFHISSSCQEYLPVTLRALWSWISAAACFPLVGYHENTQTGIQSEDAFSPNPSHQRPSKLQKFQTSSESFVRTNDVFGEAGCKQGGGWVIKGNQMQMSLPPPPPPPRPPLLLLLFPRQHSNLILNQYGVSVSLQEEGDRQTRMKWEKVDDGWGLGKGGWESREGDRERWFIKHLEGWRADRPLHFSPFTVQEIECRTACVCERIHSRVCVCVSCLSEISACPHSSR